MISEFTEQIVTREEEQEKLKVSKTTAHPDSKGSERADWINTHQQTLN